MLGDSPLLEPPPEAAGSASWSDASHSIRLPSAQPTCIVFGPGGEFAK